MFQQHLPRQSLEILKICRPSSFSDWRTVVAHKRASVFELSKIKLEVLLKKYPDIGFLIYRKIMGLLSERLNNTNKDLIACQQELAEIKTTGILS